MKRAPLPGPRFRSISSAALVTLLIQSALLSACKKRGDRGESARLRTKTVVVCAHRGASAYAPENTLAAMRKAMELGADMAELDVQQTADAHLVVMHDDRLNRTTSGRGLLWQKSLAELRRLDAGGWFDPHFAGEPIPTLEEVMDLVRDRMKLNIEVKMHGHERGIVRLVIDTIRRKDFVEHCIVTSFDHAFIDSLKAQAPEMRVGYIFVPELFHDSLFVKPVEVLSAHYKMVDAAFIERAHANGKEVHVWTVNDRDAMRRLIEIGVDGIITNYPDRAREVAQALQQ
ncbi:MAG: glycerophosphodiester phosphodiesterase family protein [candidate division KSB1 bacterium]|nr:glycerophosphodiester phosphodiesterase family protein [candidate division KSB1 bacterium]